MTQILPVSMVDTGVMSNVYDLTLLSTEELLILNSTEVAGC